MTEITVFLDISDAAYSSALADRPLGTYEPINFYQDTGFWKSGTGFRAHAYYSEKENTLVVAYAGTDDILDFMTDAQLAVKGASSQDIQAAQFARDAKRKLQSMGVADFKVAYTGHSLGGFFAQIVATQDNNANAVREEAAQMEQRCRLCRWRRRAVKLPKQWVTARRRLKGLPR